MRGLAIGGIVLALAPFGSVVSVLTFPIGNPAAHLELGRPSGPFESADLTAWVLEPLAPTAPASARPSQSNIRSRRSVANRNSNPLNIKLGPQTRRYVDIGVATISDILPTDGGRFLKFDSPETGFKAAVELLMAPGYDDLTLDRALRRWSNHGYGIEIFAGPRLDAETPVPDFGRDDLKTLLNAMAAAEGYKSATIAHEIERALTRRPPGQ